MSGQRKVDLNRRPPREPHEDQLKEADRQLSALERDLDRRLRMLGNVVGAIETRQGQQA